MKFKTPIIFLLLIFLACKANGQVKIEETTIKVFGNCDQCKDRIEESLNIDEVKFVKWNKKSKNLKLAYSNTISLDSLKQRIASVGHDTEDIFSADSVYATLPGCCRFRDNPTTH